MFKKKTSPLNLSLFQLSDERVSRAQDDPLSFRISSHRNIADVKATLGATIDALYDDNPSVFTRISRIWGAYSAWKKVIFGIVIFGGLVGIGVAAHVVALTITASISGILSFFSSLLMDNHDNASKRSKEGLKTSINGVADVLELTIQTLDKTRIELELNIDVLKSENIELATQVDRLEQILRQLSSDLKEFEAIGVKFLDTELRLSQMTQEYHLLWERFTEQTGELAKVKSDMSSEIERLRSVGSAFKQVTEMLAGTVLSDEHQRSEFLAKLQSFISAGMSQVSEELMHVKEELAQSQQSYQQLLERHALLIDRQAEQVLRLEHSVALITQAPITYGAFFQPGALIPLDQPCSKEVTHRI